jgi:putative transposase
VRRVLRDAHAGQRPAIQTVMHGASGQRCRVHFLKNVRSPGPQAAQALGAARGRTIGGPPDTAIARTPQARVAEMLRDRSPQAAARLETAPEDLWACMQCPAEHGRPIDSTHPLERLNKEMGPRTDVVGIFPNRGVVLRLVGELLMEQHDEWPATPPVLLQPRVYGPAGAPDPDPIRVADGIAAAGPTAEAGNYST